MRFTITALPIALSVLLNLVPGCALAALITVPTDYPTIQVAIDASIEGDEIVVLPGMYDENVDFKGKEIVLRSTDPLSSSVIASTAIQSEEGHTVRFAGTESPACVLEGFTISAWDEGPVVGNGTHATIRRNVIGANERSWGRSFGPGILRCDGLIRYNTIKANIAYRGKGGGLHSCHGVIEYNLISYNIADPSWDLAYGGGLFNCDGTIRHNIISHNRVQGAVAYGGGLSGCDGTVENNTITSNSVYSFDDSTACGAGLHECNGTIRNNVIANNKAWEAEAGQGGGLYGCTGSIKNNTVYGNVAVQGGGISLCSGTIVNCIIWGNEAISGPQIEGLFDATYSCIQGWAGGGIGNIALDPRLVDPANGDFHLQPDSPCVDAGAFVAGLTEDFEGDARPFDAVTEPRGDGSDFDIGADEYSPGQVITVPTDYPTIQAAINAAIHGDEIVVLPGAYEENLFFSGKDIVLRSTDLTSPTVVANTVIRGESSEPVVTFAGTESSVCLISGFTITGSTGIQGNKTHATISQNFIGGVGGHNPGAGIVRCDGLIQHNTIARNHTTVRGAGLHDCDGVIEYNLVLDNASYNYRGAGYGGGLYECDGIIRSNLIDGNRAIGNYGAFGGGLSGCDGWIENNWITSNTVMISHLSPYQAPAHGAGLYNCNGTIRNNVIARNIVPSAMISSGGGLYQCRGRIENNTIYANQADQGGGLFACDGSIVNCIVWDNTAKVSDPQIGNSSVPDYCCISNWAVGGTGNINLDPLFVDPERAEFHLQPGSPCIDAGRAVAGLDTDIEGDPRSFDAIAEPRGDGSDVDIGADEYFLRFMRVPTDYPTIQAAIDAVLEGNEIVVLPGTYEENIRFGGKNFILRSTAPTSPSVVSNTTIVGQPPVPVITFGGNESSACLLAGFTITGSTGIQGNKTRATISQNFIGGVGGYNAGAGIVRCDGLIQHNTIIRNQTTVRGAGLHDCDGVIEYNLVFDNASYDYGGAGYGGGLYECDGIIRSNLIDDNRAIGKYGAFGGGLSGCNGWIENNWITSNTVVISPLSPYQAPAHGAGLYNCNGTIRNNVIARNIVPSGVISSGGGLHQCSGRIENNTIYANQADQGGGLFACDGSIVNCIVWDNTAEVADPQIGDSITPDYCCIQDWAGGGAGNINRDPLFVDPERAEFHLQPGSPCIDAGRAVAGLDTDIEGDRRPFDAVAEPRGDGSDIDIGSDEFPRRVDGPIRVPRDYPTIQAAIDGATTGDTIIVYPGTYRENIHFRGKSIVLRSIEPTSRPVVDATIIDGGSSGSVVTFAGTETPNALLSGFTIRNGKKTWVFFGGYGAGIYGAKTRARISFNLITENRAEGAGGGIAGCHGIIENNRISHNVCHWEPSSSPFAGAGAGLCGCDGIIRGNSIFGNQALRGAGVAGCDGVIENNVISGNTAYGRTPYGSAGSGGGLYNCNGVIRGNLVHGNSALDVGGGFYACDGEIRSNTITKNRADKGAALSSCWGGTIESNWISENIGEKSSGIYGGRSTIRNNVITGNRGGAAIADTWTTIVNNTVVNNSAGLDRCNGPISNTIIWGNTGPSLEASTTPLFSCIENWTSGGIGNISADPHFVDPDNGDFHLRPDSPCIDAGAFVEGLTEDFEGGPRPFDAIAEPRGDGSDFDIGADEYLPLGAAPNLRFASADFGPAAPIVLEPGDPITLGAFIENSGQLPSEPVWFEFWGSRTGGLTLDTFLADSKIIEPVPPGGGLPFEAAKPLYDVPDGRYTVVFALDRPGQLDESDERDNRAAVAAKTLLVVRPETDVDLVLSQFRMSATLQPGQRIGASGRITNRGSEPSGPFWIEFWASRTSPVPATDCPSLETFAADSIRLPALDPGASVELSDYPRTLHALSKGIYFFTCFVDRPDDINELDETNNYGSWLSLVGSGGASTLPGGVSPAADSADLVVPSLEFVPRVPVAVKQGDPVAVSVVVENRGDTGAGPFWLEVFGSKTGGFQPDVLLLDQSERIPWVGAGERLELDLIKPLLGVPDGRWTPMAIVDRLGETQDPVRYNNRRAASGPRMLVVNPPTGANLVLEDLSAAFVRRPDGEELHMSGTVRNAGTGAAGPFWIEFWGSTAWDYPRLDFMLGESIRVPGLGPGEDYVFTDFNCSAYPGYDPNVRAWGCVIDRPDAVNETDETDNHDFIWDHRGGS